MNITNFQVDREKCIGCGLCVKVCPGGVLYLDGEQKCAMQPIADFGWNGCWRCEHCLAVCPKGAISIFGKDPKNSLPPIRSSDAASVLAGLMANRHSCRRYQNKNVDGRIIADMIARLGNAPNGGNKQLVEFTLVDDKEQMDVFRRLAYDEMERLASQGIYPAGFDKASYEDMKLWKATVRPDMLFCCAPHILIQHAPVGRGEPERDVIIAGTYFELLCASRSLGAVMLTFPLGVLETMPQIKALLGIPDDHYIGMIIGFGYPEIHYARGVQKTIERSRIHRPTFGETEG